MAAPDEEEPLVVRGKSSYYINGGRFTLAIAAGFLVLQLLVYSLRWTDSLLLFPFGVVAAAALLLGLGIIVAGTRALCCRACGVGLHQDRSIALSERGEAEVADAVDRGDARAIVDVVAANPRRPKEQWTRLWLKYCPNCQRVAVVHVEQTRAGAGKRPEHVFSGTDVGDLLEISDVDVG